MKIAILGATGPSGQQAVKLGLQAGHTVLALVRNPDGVKEKHDNLQVKLENVQGLAEVSVPMLFFTIGSHGKCVWQKP